MNEREIRQGLDSGRLHPFPLLQHLAAEGDKEGARFVAETGPGYVQGRERLRFRGLVRELVPEVFEAEAAEVRRRSERKQHEHSSALSEALRAKAAERKERAEWFLPVGNPDAAGGWNLPQDVPRK